MNGDRADLKQEARAHASYQSGCSTCSCMFETCICDVRTEGGGGVKKLSKLEDKQYITRLKGRLCELASSARGSNDVRSHNLALFFYLNTNTLWTSYMEAPQSSLSAFCFPPREIYLDSAAAELWHVRLFGLGRVFTSRNHNRGPDTPEVGK